LRRQRVRPPGRHRHCRRIGFRLHRVSFTACSSHPRRRPASRCTSPLVSFRPNRARPGGRREESEREHPRGHRVHLGLRLCVPTGVCRSTGVEIESVQYLECAVWREGARVARKQSLLHVKGQSSQSSQSQRHRHRHRRSPSPPPPLSGVRSPRHRSGTWAPSRRPRRPPARCWSSCPRRPL